MSDQSFLMDRATRFAIMVGLAVLMFVPLLFITLIIEERAGFQAGTLQEVGSQWGGRQYLSGPVLVIPVTREVTDEQRENGRTVTSTRIEAGDPVILLPAALRVEGKLATEMRARGIFEVPVYAADVTIRFGFDRAELARALAEKETMDWSGARIEMHLTGTRGLRGAMTLTRGADTLPLEPGSLLPGRSGVHARVAEADALDGLTLSFTLNGAQDLLLAPAGRQTEVTLQADWPHPSFTGAFLPDSREVTEAGFTATWSVPHLARDLPQLLRGEYSFAGIDQSQFGVALYNPVDFYQKVSRAAKYGILFIALTFLSVFLMEKAAARPVHPAQYLLIGVAQCVFFLLLLSFAEQIGFTPAYALAAVATIVLLAFYGMAALGLGRRAWVLTSVLVLLYATLYFILQSTEYALLAGSILAFLTVAVTMVLTRNESWFGERRAVSAPAAGDERTMPQGQ